MVVEECGRQSLADKCEHGVCDQHSGAGHAGLRKPGAHLAAKSESNQSGSSSLDQVVIARIRQPRCDDPWELEV